MFKRLKCLRTSHSLVRLIRINTADLTTSDFLSSDFARVYMQIHAYEQRCTCRSIWNSSGKAYEVLNVQKHA